MRLTPLRETALRAMCRGTLTLTPDVGWRSDAGVPGTWNSFTIGYLERQSVALTYDDRDGTRRCRITGDGRSVLASQDWRASA